MAYQRVTLAQLEDRLAERLGGEETFWSEPERRGALNEALAVWQLLTGEVVATTTSTLAGAQHYLTYTSTTEPAATFLRVRCDPCAMVVAATADTSGGDDTFAFTATVSYGVATISYLWNFGDTVTSTSSAPVHTYSTASTYTATVTATDSYSCVATATVEVTPTISEAPVADFTWYGPVTGDGTWDAGFTDLSIGDITDWLWDFGDSNTSTVQNAINTYTSCANGVVPWVATLTVTGPGGSDNTSKNIDMCP